MELQVEGPGRQSMRSGWTCVFLTVVGLMACTISWFWVPDCTPVIPCRSLNNAAWIGVEWMSDAVEAEQVESLAHIASDHGIEYLFPFTTYLQADGTFSPSYDYAHDFVSAYRRTGEEQAILAWIGVPLVQRGRLGIDGWVDLSDAATRQQIAGLSAALVQTMGFDGVHLDVETVRDGDEGYLLLLEEVRAALGGHTLSVAGAYWLPTGINHLPGLNGYRWSQSYIRAVSARADQIVVMTYDSVMPLPALHRLWMREQVRGIGGALCDVDERSELLLGVSASRERTLTHMPWAENVRSGLAGLGAGLWMYPKAGSVVDGVGVYAAWEANERTWRLLDRWQRGRCGSMGEPR